uniref:Uncharacterized protein n=1 Tax=Timema douglasi TaxID=61478 RepID=A0A7R8VS88_TIMDO|nr:unnamed protein product [Timema douglasi]
MGDLGYRHIYTNEAAMRIVELRENIVNKNKDLRDIIDVTSSSGMPSNSVSTLALLSSLLAAALCGATAEAPRGTLMAQSEDGILLPASMNDLDDLSVVEEDFEQVSRGRDPTVGGNKEQSLSSLYQLLQAALHQNQLQQQQGRRLEEAGSETLYPVLPAAVPLIRQPDGLNKDEDKRGSYMSLCHFKICNMGRKRNLRGTFWPRISSFTCVRKSSTAPGHNLSLKSDN